MRWRGHDDHRPNLGRGRKRPDPLVRVRMGTSPSTPRVVLDTNVVLSALIFIRGNLAALRQGWQHQQFTPLVSKATVEELIRVIAYPKFRLSDGERQDLLSDYLPFCETVQVPNPGPAKPQCRDPFDVPFLELALEGRAESLVTGDGDLLSLVSEFSCPILTVDDFLVRVQAG